MQRFVLVTVAAALIAASCGGGSAETTTTTVPTVESTTTTTALPPAPATTRRTTTTTTTTLPPPPSSPLNGVAAEDPALLDRRVLAVKIDNHANARPQSGLQEADAVVEIRVEAGLTRFIALFHDNESTYAGPVRSGRPTDGSFVAHLGAPFAISGAQPWVLRYIRNRGVNIISDPRPGMFRVGGRRAPHNLYTDPSVLRQIADSRDYPDDPPERMFELGEFAPDEQDAGEIVLNFSDETTITWRWDGSQYLRFHNGREHEWMDADGERGQVAADVLVVIMGSLYTAYDPAGQGSAVPATETVGVGDALVFADGAVAMGKWFRDDAGEPFTLVNEDETETMFVPPGTPWVSVFPSQRSVTWAPYEPPPPDEESTEEG